MREASRPNHAVAMSALPPKADMCSATRYVRFVPIADIASFVIGTGEQVGGTLWLSAGAAAGSLMAAKRHDGHPCAALHRRVQS